MQTVRLRDVPKGQRLSHFFTYYRWQLFYTVFGVACAVMLIGSWLRPPADVSILWLTSNFNMMTDTALRDALGEVSCDVNGDGRSRIALQYIEFPDNFSSSLEAQMETLTLISSGRFSVFLLNENAKNWFEENGMIGTWSDYRAALADAGGGAGTEASPAGADAGGAGTEAVPAGADAGGAGTEASQAGADGGLPGDGELFAVPCSELDFFRGTGISETGETYLVIGAAPADEEKLAAYRAQVREAESLLAR